ncbi:MAG: glycosyltransferase family 9 protein [Bacteroidota bacterium]|nr:glycosyltransferase family 9 protein [Bacteroidota bacterium]MDP4232778.1 glycosyltransferase family 9 protein [Bacteroidota bacterium]MDP4242540.1 glycosyltransferase family 9 protein [Bacteroidota bacterium]MDP4288881.1 glycosyltransferase family 9 protein [Bacteroidota bacterium]
MRALIIETAFVGDVIVSLGLARELKRIQSDAFIAYLVRPEAAAIVKVCPDVDDVIIFDKYGADSGRSGVLKKAAELNIMGFDTIIALHGSRRSQLLVSRVDAIRKLGFVPMRSAGLTHTVADAGWSNRYERAILPLTTLFANVEHSSLPRLDCGVFPEASQFATRFDRCVALAPGSVWATKQWGASSFASLAQALSSAKIGIIIIGGADSRNAADDISALAGESNVLDLTGKTSFAQSGAAIAAASLLVSNDSAPAHLAIAVGTRVLTIFGPTVSAFGFAPPKGRGEVIEMADLWCRPCASHGSNACPVYTHACMKEITPEVVFERVITALSLNS